MLISFVFFYVLSFGITLDSVEWIIYGTEIEYETTRSKISVPAFIASAPYFFKFGDTPSRTLRVEPWLYDQGTLLAMLREL